MNKTHGGNIWKIAKESGLKPEDILDFSASINPLGLSPRTAAAIKNAMLLLDHYPEPGAESIRAELSLSHNLPEENILVGNGSTEFIYLLPQVFRPQKAVIAEPGFSEYRNSLASFGCEVVDFHAREDEGFFPDIKRLCSIIKEDCDVVYLCNPANPTGVLLSKNDILKIAGECRRCGVMLIVDEAFMDFVEEESVKKDAILMDNLIVIRSMTKFFSMAGLRLGYIIANKRVIKRLERFKPPWSVNTLSILAGIESLRDSAYIKNTKEWLKEERPFLFEGLNAVPFLKAYPNRVNYLLVKIVAGNITAKDIQEDLLKSGILIRECSTFIGLDGTFFRVAVKKREENRLFLNAINMIGVKEVLP